MRGLGESVDGGRRASRWLVLAVVLVAFAIRAAWGLSRPADTASLATLPDQVEYVSLGRSLLDSGRMSFVDPRFNDTVYAFRMPGYPALIALCGGNLRVVRLAQAALDASTVLATIWLARRWLTPRLSLLAGLFVAVDPLFVYFSGLILSETLFACLLAWGVACLAHGTSPWSGVTSRVRRSVWIVGVGLLIASIYVRPAAIVLPVVLIAAAGWLEMRSPAFVPDRTRWPVLTFVAVATVMALLPWAIRNRALLDRWIFTTTNGGFTLYDAWQPLATGASDLSVLDELPVLANLNEVQRADYLQRLAIDAATADPWRIVRLIPARLGRLWSPVPLSAEYGSRPLYVVVAAIHAIPLMALAIVGIFASTSIGRRGKLMLLAPAIVTSIVYGLTVGSLRYRMPVGPMTGVLAASALTLVRPRARTEAADGG